MYRPLGPDVITLDSLDHRLYLTLRTQGSKAQVSSQLAERCMCVISNLVTFPQPREEALWSSHVCGELRDPESRGGAQRNDWGRRAVRFPSVWGVPLTQDWEQASLSHLGFSKLRWQGTRL